MRVSSLPTIFGEKIVSRILDRENLQIDLTKLGLEPESLENFKKAISRPWGILLVTGPTGSGKTNTLYSAISTLNAMEKNIMTAEDPVEFYIPGINQVNIRDEISLTFGAALRAFLRQDPDIMLVGEMRDSETVDTAIKAALAASTCCAALQLPAWCWSTIPAHGSICFPYCGMRAGPATALRILFFLFFFLQWAPRNPFPLPMQRIPANCR